MFSGIRAITPAVMGLGSEEGMMPGYQPNMPCTHYQQLSRHKCFDPVDSINVLYYTGWTTEEIYTLIWT